MAKNDHELSKLHICAVTDAFIKSFGGSAQQQTSTDTSSEGLLDPCTGIPLFKKEWIKESVSRLLRTNPSGKAPALE